MLIFNIALTLFLVANPIGNIPVFVSLVKDFEFSRQRAILIREAIFSMILAYLFLFLGNPFLNLIRIDQHSVSVAGGILVLVVALKMIFPKNTIQAKDQLPQEPFIVPIATPLICGGGVFTAIIIYAQGETDLLSLSLGILVAWIAVIGVLGSSAYLQRLLGKRGLIAMEQLMGMLLLMLAVEIIGSGIHTFISNV